MKHKKTNKIIVVALIVAMFTALITGCSKDEDENVSVDKITLSKGAIIEEVNDGYRNFELKDNSYYKLEYEEAIVLYDEISGNYIYNKDRKLYASAYNEDFEIVDTNIVSALMSKGGEYLSYFTNDSYYELKVIDLKHQKEIELNSDVIISGTVLCWIDNESMAYYGINSEGVNGIYLYNLKTKEEKLIHKIEVGYVESMKSYNDGVIFIEQNIDDNKIIKTINKEYNAVNISEEFISIKDIIISSKGAFVLGKLKDDSFSIYRVDENNINRLIYDFPMYINVEKGLSQDREGNPLFIGKETPSGDSSIYTISDDYVKKLYTSKNDMNFVEIN